MSKIKEPCSPELRACVDALIAKGYSEDRAWPICKAKLGEAFRHRDFQRIYDEFLTQYPNKDEGITQYYDWINVLRLDETKPYENCRESYYWKKEDIQFIREDAENKYYEVEIGFPTRSMNGNVYKKRDFIAASLTLAGKSPSLNHKNEFWFSPKNPDNRWGNIEIVEGKFHENTSKALMKVPKNMVCPVCNGGLMTELIDKKQIYNVSLEGDCKGGQCVTGECEGFVYLDPPFTLLTTDVLPGIPMTRIKPLENIMVEALHVNETKTVRRIRAKMAETKKKEDMKDVGNSEVIKGTLYAGFPAKSTGKGEITQGEKPVEADATGDVQGGECPEGFHKNEAGECVKEVPRHATRPETAVGTTPGPLVQGAEQLLELSKLRVSQFEAEHKAKTLEEKVEILKKTWLETEAKHQTQVGINIEQSKTIDKLEKQLEQATKDLIEKTADSETWKRKRDEISGSRDDYKQSFEKLKTEHETLLTKYHTSMDTNLKLTRDVTQANEDYLKVSKENEDLKEAISRKDIQLKKGLKIRVKT